MKIRKPTLFVDIDRSKNNIHKMAMKAREQGVDFRPHFKTHQSAYMGDYFGDEGVSKIAVSSVEMANYFADYGWHDITLAVPANILEMEEINSIAEKSTLNLLVDSVETAHAIAMESNNFLTVYIKIDCGYHRTGVDYRDRDKINSIIETLSLSDKVRWEGFLTHTGQNYSGSGRDEILANHRKALEIMAELKEAYFFEHPHIKVSIGDTPAMSITDDFGVADEIRPGNFVFYDAMQYNLGSCSQEDIAMFMVCPVISKNEDRREIVIYGGAVHFSKDYYMKDGIKSFGLPFLMKSGVASGVNDGETILKAVSQEHGIISCSEEFFANTKIGDLIGVYPAHSCLAVDLMRSYYTIDGERIDIYTR